MTVLIGQHLQVTQAKPTLCLVPSTAVRLNFEVTITDRKSGSPATAESFVLLKLTFGFMFE